MSSNLIGQVKNLYFIESKLINGDRQALFELANYFDSSRKVRVLIGCQFEVLSLSSIAERIYTQNCLFTNAELPDDLTSSIKLIQFLDSNYDKIEFSEQINAFLITPLENRNVNYEIRELYGAKRKLLNDSAASLLRPKWVKDNNIDLLIKHKEPIALLKIASELFKNREKGDNFYNGEEFINLLEFLTGLEIGIEDQDKTVLWNRDYWFYRSNTEVRLNLLIYFSKFYSQYKWSEEESLFINSSNSNLYRVVEFPSDSIKRIKDCYNTRYMVLNDELRRDLNGWLPRPDQNPSFKGGLEELKIYFKSKSLSDPKTKLLNFKVSISFRVTCEGKAGNFKIISNGRNELETYANQVLGIVNAMPQNWQPAVKDKKEVDCYQVLSFNIKEGSLEDLSIE